ncbi:MAG: carboxypeptidase regulatory-like domain-containing protein, partial [Acidobacteriota bacterium]|nr:carboxypeptidase regulatory-like domain-containing protein [Acidobacteriota bacterium]
MDTSQAVLPGAGITAINTQTGVETKTTANNVGVYSFPSLQTGVYNIVAKVDGFQTATKTDVKLGVGAQVRLNFEMVVAGTATEVEVATTAENMILDAGSSTGTVMQEELVGELPLVGNNVMELLNTMGGVVKAEEPIFSASTQTFAGVSSSGINITRDGVSANEVRYTSGITPPSNINQEVVGEFKMVLSPVDAELGRGAGQVQIITKSGANAFHGSGVWNNQNTALDAGKFEDKRIGNTPPWRNLNNYTISASGPIIRNKTFFFASWDHQLVRSKEWVTANALTGCARKGIYRYFDGIVGINANDNADYTIHAGYKMPHSKVTASATDGTPFLHDPQGTSGQLMYQNIFGDDGGVVPMSELRNDCQGLPELTANSQGPLPEGVELASTWDPNRVAADSTGYVSKYLDLMPVANYFGAGDGLNIAGY